MIIFLNYYFSKQEDGYIKNIVLLKTLEVCYCSPNGGKEKKLKDLI